VIAITFLTYQHVGNSATLRCGCPDSTGGSNHIHIHGCECRWTATWPVGAITADNCRITGQHKGCGGRRAKTTFTCQKCKREFQKRRSLALHKKQCPKGCPISCELCDYISFISFMNRKSFCGYATNFFLLSPT
jgi:hypothetical protein